MIHIYWMAPSIPSPTQRRATTMCKVAVRPKEVAAPGREATCPECIAACKAVVKHHRDALEQLGTNDQYSRVTVQLDKTLALLPKSEWGAQ